MSACKCEGCASRKLDAAQRRRTPQACTKPEGTPRTHLASRPWGQQSCLQRGSAGVRACQHAPAACMAHLLAHICSLLRATFTQCSCALASRGPPLRCVPAARSSAPLHQCQRSGACAPRMHGTPGGSHTSVAAAAAASPPASPAAPIPSVAPPSHAHACGRRVTCACVSECVRARAVEEDGVLAVAV